jgi:prephenate dehydrogenase
VTDQLPPVFVLGLGLIGGSLLRAAADHTTVSGWSPSTTTRAAAAADGYRVHDDLDTALKAAAKEDALVVLATPLTTFAELLPRIDVAAPEVRLTDVGSVKGVVADQVAQLVPKARFVGSHPMTGTQHSGWSAGSAELFQKRVWVTCPHELTPVADWLPVAKLALAVGSEVVPLEAANHDDAVARVSHLPHLLALALAQVGFAGGDQALALAAGSFADGTRVAATRPELIRAMCETNAQPLITALDEVLAIIGVARGSLASTGSLVKITEGGHEARMTFESRGAALIPVELSGEDLVEQLLAVGVAGGRVVAVTGSDDDPTVNALYPDEVEE